MARIPTSIRRRLAKLRRRGKRELQERRYVRSSHPFRFDAGLRIAGLGSEHDNITARTGIAPSYTHRKGDPFGRAGNFRKEDMWILNSPLGERASLDEHLDWLWRRIEPHKEYFRELTARAA